MNGISATTVLEELVTNVTTVTTQLRWVMMTLED